MGSFPSESVTEPVACASYWDTGGDGALRMLSNMYGAPHLSFFAACFADFVWRLWHRYSPYHCSLDDRPVIRLVLCLTVAFCQRVENVCRPDLSASVCN